MSISIETLEQREKGNLPLSIGTSLAIEAACGMPTLEGEARIAPGESPPIMHYSQLWVNLRTLFRNLLGAISADDRRRVQSDDLVPIMISEMHAIEATISRVTQGRCLVMYYVCTFTSLNRRFSRALIKTASTEKQKIESEIEKHVLNALLEDSNGMDIRKFDVDITAGAQDSLILTHMPIDLLSRFNFTRLELLESHTGKIKPYTQWSSKLTGKPLDRIPFNQFTLQLFGDGTMFNTMPAKVKEEILAMAAEDQWTTATKPDRMRMSINKVRDPRVKTFFLSLFT